MHVIAHLVRYGHDLCGLFVDAQRAEEFATRSGGVVVPLYDLTELERAVLLVPRRLPEDGAQAPEENAR